MGDERRASTAFVVRRSQARGRVTSWLWRFALALLVAGLTFSVGALLRLPVAWPFDVVFNLGSTISDPALRPPDDGRVRVVFLQHGLWRTSASLGRLERSLRALGYEVHNPGYPSTEARLEAHAERLAEAIEARCAAGPVDELAFIGHSMGGLVIEEYLRRDDARPPHACVYLATPHRGAVLADQRRNWFLFEWVMGDQAARQLATTDPFHLQPIPYGDVSGAIVGSVGAGNAAIPGNDDGTVGVLEARFDGVGDEVVVAAGHTRITVATEPLEQVAWFLRHGRFRR